MGNKQSNKIPDTADPGSRARRRTDPGSRRRAATMAAIRRADGRVDYNTRDVERIYPNWYARRGTAPGIYSSAAQNLDKAFQDAREAKATREAANNMRSSSPATPATPYPDEDLARIIRQLEADEETRRNSAILQEVPSPVNYSKRDVESLYNWYAPDAQNLDKAFQDAIEAANNESYDSYSSNDVTMEDPSDFSQQREANARAVARMEAAMAARAAVEAARAARVSDLPDWDRRVIPLEDALADAERALEDAERALDDSDVVVRLFGAGKRPRDPNWEVSESKRPRDPTWDVSSEDVDWASYLGNMLVQAVIDEKAELVRHLLSTSGIDVNTVNDSGYTALMVAAEINDTELVRQLLAAPGIDVNTVNDSGDTALMFAASEGHAEVVRQLLAFPGIDMYLKNDRDKSAWLLIDFIYRQDIDLLFKQKLEAEAAAAEAAAGDGDGDGDGMIF